MAGSKIHQLRPRSPEMSKIPARRDSHGETKEIAAALREELLGLAQGGLPSGGRFNPKPVVARVGFRPLSALRASLVQSSPAVTRTLCAARHRTTSQRSRHGVCSRGNRVVGSLESANSKLQSSTTPERRFGPNLLQNAAAVARERSYNGSVVLCVPGDRHKHDASFRLRSAVVCTIYKAFRGSRHALFRQNQLY